MQNLEILCSLCEIDCRYLYEDAVFAVKDSLILDWPELNDATEAKELGFEKLPYCKVHHDFKLAQV